MTIGDDRNNEEKEINQIIKEIDVEFGKELVQADIPEILKRIGGLNKSSAKILLLLAKSVERMSKSSKRLEFLTKVLIVLTVILILKDTGILNLIIKYFLSIDK